MWALPTLPKIAIDLIGMRMFGLTVKDLKKMQTQLPDYPMELVDGAIIVMSPSGYESDEVALEVGRQLANWVKPRRLGRVTGSRAGFDVPALGGVRAPDGSFVIAERLRRAPRSYAQLVPDLMVEVKSPIDSLETIQEKINRFLAQGARVGILVNPENETVEIYRLNQETVVLQSQDTLTVPDLLPGWEVPIAELWSPVFDEE